jgi:hypothetical protein
LLGSGELFDAPKGPSPAKQLLAAASIKAKEQSDAAERAAKGDPNQGDHLSSLNQPRAEHESDGDSLGSGELFDAPKGPCPAKPPLTAAITAREQTGGTEHAAKAEA